MNTTRTIIRKLEKASDVIGGYLNSSFRTNATDDTLVAASLVLGLSFDDLSLWVDSRCARHFMGGSLNLTVTNFVNEIKTSLPALHAEVKGE